MCNVVHSDLRMFFLFNIGTIYCHLRRVISRIWRILRKSYSIRQISIFRRTDPRISPVGSIEKKTCHRTVKAAPTLLQAVRTLELWLTDMLTVDLVFFSPWIFSTQNWEHLISLGNIWYWIANYIFESWVWVKTWADSWWGRQVDWTPAKSNNVSRPPWMELELGDPPAPFDMIIS